MYRVDCSVYVRLVVFPTGVGVYRACTSAMRRHTRFPHRRGGVPRFGSLRFSGLLFSPQAWGCTALESMSGGSQTCFPHRRGGVPKVCRERRRVARFSPQAWGCTGCQSVLFQLPTVFPTGVGVYRSCFLLKGDNSSFPHRRGGVPSCSTVSLSISPFSPHAWGCTGCSRDRHDCCCVFPTGVGVYRLSQLASRNGSRFPHRRGGVPHLYIVTVRFIGFPHRRGGVP